MRNEIDKLIKTIKEEKIYTDYEIIYKEILENEHISKLVTEIKVLQKKLTKEEHTGNIETFNMINKEYNSKLNVLNEIPLYIIYKNKIDELNELFSLIEEKINNELLK